MTLDAHPDAAILGQIRSLAANLTDERAKSVVTSLLDAVALNPQPLPPDPPPELERIGAIIAAVQDLVALNPQPIPPG
jgi:hypothetical protein